MHIQRIVHHHHSIPKSLMDIEHANWFIWPMSNMTFPEIRTLDEELDFNDAEQNRASFAIVQNKKYFDVSNYKAMALSKMHLQPLETSNDMLSMFRPVVMWTIQRYNASTMLPFPNERTICTSACLALLILSTEPISEISFTGRKTNLYEQCMIFPVVPVPEHLLEFSQLVMVIAKCVKKSRVLDFYKHAFKCVSSSIQKMIKGSVSFRSCVLSRSVGEGSGPTQAARKCLDGLKMDDNSDIMCFGEADQFRVTVMNEVAKNVSSIFMTGMTKTSMFDLIHIITIEVIDALCEVRPKDIMKVFSIIENMVTDVERRKCSRGCASVYSISQMLRVSDRSAKSILFALYGSHKKAAVFLAKKYPDLNISANARCFEWDGFFASIAHVICECICKVIRLRNEHAVSCQGERRGTKRPLEDESEPTDDDLGPKPGTSDNLVKYVIRNIKSSSMFKHLTIFDLAQLRMTCRECRLTLELKDFQATNSVVFPRGPNALKVPNEFYHTLVRHGLLLIHLHTNSFDFHPDELKNVSNLKTNLKKVPSAHLSNLRSLTISFNTKCNYLVLDLSSLPILLSFKFECKRAVVNTLKFPKTLVILDIKCSMIENIGDPDTRHSDSNLDRLRVQTYEASDTSINVSSIRLSLAHLEVPACGWPDIKTKILVLRASNRYPTINIAPGHQINNLLYLDLDWSHQYVELFSSLHQAASLVAFRVMVSIIDDDQVFQHNLYEANLPSLEAFAIEVHRPSGSINDFDDLFENSRDHFDYMMKTAFAGQWSHALFDASTMVWSRDKKKLSRETAKFFLLHEYDYFPNL